MLNVKIKKLDKEAKIPTYGSEDAACVDLYALDDGKLSFEPTGTVVVYRTGIALEIPKGYVGEIAARSSIYKTSPYILANGIGKIDADYRGEVMVVFRDVSNGICRHRYKKGDRICQLSVVPVPKINFIEVEELSSTDRDEGGFGSTGK